MGWNRWEACSTHPTGMHPCYHPSISMTTSGVTFLVGAEADVADVVSDLLEPLDLGAG